MSGGKRHGVPQIHRCLPPLRRFAVHGGRFTGVSIQDMQKIYLLHGMDVFRPLYGSKIKDLFSGERYRAPCESLVRRECRNATD